MREHHEAWQGRAETSCKIAEMRLCTDAFIRDQVFVKEGDCDESIPQQRTRQGHPLRRSNFFQGVYVTIVKVPPPKGGAARPFA